MKQYRVTTVETIEVPDDVELAAAPNGEIVGFKLPDGRIIRPWICYEAETGNGEDFTNLTFEDLVDLDISSGELESRTFEKIDG